MRKLLNDFYAVEHLESMEGKWMAKIKINGGHSIFDGHFPGQPVVPGVCMMQIVKEITEQILNYPLRIALVLDMKFLAVIDPVKNPKVEVSITCSKNEDVEQVVAAISSGDMVHFKFRGNFVQE